MAPKNSHPESSKLETVFRTGLAEHRAAAGAMGVVSIGQPPVFLCGGQFTFDGDSPKVTREALFDVASLTKVIVTTTLAMQAYDEGRLSLDARLGDFLDGMTARGADATIRQVMAHCAGFPEGMPFYRTHAAVTSREEQHALVKAVDLVYAPESRTVYSDIGFILLGYVLKAIYSRRLDDLAEERIFRPLGLSRSAACFVPTGEGRRHCVPTECSAPNGMPWQGVVHDETARWMHGIAGEAGLFISAEGLAQFAACLLTGGHPLVSPKTLGLFTTPAQLVDGSTRALGWDTGRIPGQGDAPLCFCHTGYTGTTLWVCPEQKKAVFLLTNAVYPRREEKQRFFPWRNQVIAEAFS